MVNRAPKKNKVTRELNSETLEPRSILFPIDMTDVKGGARMLQGIGTIHMRDASQQKIGPGAFRHGPTCLSDTALDSSYISL